MKIKRFIALLLVSCLAFSSACAEGGGSLWDSIGSWFSQAWKDVSDWVSNAWGDASKWIDQAWKDASPWLTDIWGDVSTWAAQTYDSASKAVSAWWTQTFNTVTAATGNAWSWINKENLAVHAMLAERYKDILASARDGAGSAEEDINAAYGELMKKLDLNDEDIAKVMETITAYAEEKGISASSMKKIMLPYLAQLTADSEGKEDGQIPALAVAQYLTGIVEKLGIGNEDQARQLINSLDELLKAE